MAAYRGTFVAAGQQVADAPAGYRNSLKFSVSTAQSSLGASDELSVLIPIEGVRTARLALGSASAAAVTFGFWIKAHRTGIYSGSLRNSAKNRSCPFSFAVNGADIWEYKAVTVAGDTSGTWLTDTGVGLSLNICIAGGSSRLGAAGSWSGSDCSGVTSSTNGVAATSDTVQLTGVVVLPGVELPASDRSSFIMRPYDQELTLCRRYLWLTQSGAGVTYSTTSGQFMIPHRGMRIAPTGLTATAAIAITNPATGNWTQSSAAAADSGSTAEESMVNLGNFSGLTANQMVFITSGGGKVMIDARL
jgi:hypothetical protein